MSISLLRNFAKFSYLIVLIYIPVWLYLIPTDFSWQLALLFWWIPLLPPLVGIIKGRFYTMSWASFLMVIPFSHGVMVWLAGADESRWGMAELLLTIVYFVSFMLMAKKLKQQQPEPSAEI